MASADVTPKIGDFDVLYCDSIFHHVILKCVDEAPANMEALTMGWCTGKCDVDQKLPRSGTTGNINAIDVMGTIAADSLRRAMPSTAVIKAVFCSS